MNKLGIALVVLLCGGLAHAEINASAPIPDGLGKSAEELAAWAAIDEDKWVRARELADALLKKNASSYVGHYALGVAMHYGEGDLARSVYHLEQSLLYFEKRYGALPQPEHPWRWHLAALQELVYSLGEMDRPEPQLVAIERYNAAYKPRLLSHRVWPLMKLRRFDEARKAAQLAIASGESKEQAMLARSELCAVESEAGDRERAHRACKAVLPEYVRGGHIAFTNAAEAALAVLRFDEAEQFLIEATKRVHTSSWSNPFIHLTALYLTEGRMPEAIAALRGAEDLRVRRPAWLDQHDRAQLDGVAAELLLVSGHTDRAVRLAERAASRPDRQGTHSGNERQQRAAAALRLAAALSERARHEEEDASASGFIESLKLRKSAMADRFAAWRARRQAARMLADEDFLVRTMQPYTEGGLNLPEWLEGEVVGALGAGVVLRALETAKQKAPPAWNGYLLAFDAEAHLAKGDARRALELAESSLQALPHAEVLLSARVAAVAAEAARREGDLARAHKHHGVVLARDPDVIRRLGFRLPVRVEHDGSSVARRAAAILDSSPRFAVEDGAALHISFSSGAQPRACLVGAKGEQIECATVDTQGDDKTVARALVRELHHVGLSLKTNLAQEDSASLDGSPTAERASLRVKSLLDSLAK